MASSVPSMASTATAARSLTTTVCPTSNPASARATSRPYSMSFWASAEGRRRLMAPAAAIWSWSSAVDGMSVIPSRPRASATPPIRLSVLFTARRARTAIIFRSGTMPAKICLCFTCPAMTATLTPPALRASMQRPSWPSDTQWISSTAEASAGSVSSLMATATTRQPAPRAAPATRNGKRPLPAINPSGEASAGDGRAIRPLPRCDAGSPA